MSKEQEKKNAVAVASAVEQTERLSSSFTGSELVIGLVGAVGTRLDRVCEKLTAGLNSFKYDVNEIHVSQDVIKYLTEEDLSNSDEYLRISNSMTAGDDARLKSGDNAILALGAAAKISGIRPESIPKDVDPNVLVKKAVLSRQAHIIKSLKRREEVDKLRDIYQEGFYLIGVYSDDNSRLEYLMQKGISKENAEYLIDRDENEHLPYGQDTKDTFHLSDFFINLEGCESKDYKSILRILNIIFGNPYKTPSFDEFAMFMAFVTSLQSDCLSRQVGAVIANRHNDIIATGFNGFPKYSGGLYRPEYDKKTQDIIDCKNGKDYMRGFDANTREIHDLVEDLAKEICKLNGFRDNYSDFHNVLLNSRIKDITEYGRSVHAEMEAIVSCARNGVSLKGATLYCTTFPCHNCARHIVASGIERVVYIEPYVKSRALKLHNDSICVGFNNDDNKVRFEPFIGVGPRRFFDLFSMNLSSGYPIKRKNNDTGDIVSWIPKHAEIRMQMIPTSYIENEYLASKQFITYREMLQNGS